jgi:hypothetical protein
VGSLGNPVCGRAKIARDTASIQIGRPQRVLRIGLTGLGGPVVPFDRVVDPRLTDAQMSELRCGARMPRIGRLPQQMLDLTSVI